MPRVKQFNEDEVLKKAMCLFWRNGYHATSMQDLVNYLGINRASIYDTYGDKKALFDKAFEHYLEINHEQVLAFFKSQKSVKSGFRVFFERGIQEAVCDQERKGCFAINVGSELVPNDNEMAEVLVQNKRFFEKAFYNFLLSGVEKGEISSGKDLKALARSIHTFYNGLKIVSKTDTDEKALLASVDVFLTLLD